MMFRVDLSIHSDNSVCKYWDYEDEIRCDVLYWFT